MKPTKLELILEAERRGILPEDKKPLLTEARRRGLIPESDGLAALRAEAAKPGAQALGPIDYLTDLGKSIASGLDIASGALAKSAGAETGVVAGVKRAAATAIGTGGALVEGVTAMIPETPTDVALLAAGTVLPVVAVSKMASPALKVAEKYTPTFLDTFKAIRAAGTMNIPLTPAEIAGSQGMARVESLLEKLPFSGGMIQRFNEYRHGLLTKARNEMLDSYGPRLTEEAIGLSTQDVVGGKLAQEAEKRAATLQSKRSALLSKFGATKETEQMGDDIIATLLQKRDAVKLKAGRLYDAVDEVIPPGRNRISDVSIRSTAKRIISEDIGRARLAVDPEANKLLEFFAKGPQGGRGYTYQELKTLRSKLGDLVAQQNTAAKMGLSPKLGSSTTEGRFFAQLREAVDQDLKAYSDSIGGAVKDRLDIANAFYRDYKEIFDNKTIRKMVTGKPQVIYDQLVKPGDIADIRAIKNAVGKSAFDKTFKRRFVDDLVGGTADDLPDAASIMSRINSYPPETVRELLTTTERSQLARFVNTAEMPDFGLSEIKQRVAGLMKKSPTTVYNAVAAGDPTVTRAAKEVMRAKRFRVYNRRVLEDIIGSAEDDIFTDKKVARELGNYGLDALRLHFSDAELEAIRNIGRVSSLMARGVAQGANPSGTAQTLLQWSQAAGAGAILVNRDDDPVIKAGKIGALTLTAPILAKFYLSPTGRKLLADGINMSARESGAAVLAGRIAAFAAIAKKEIRDEDDAERKSVGETIPWRMRESPTK